jgi:tetratricopeptide (TPR) repeat protein
LCNHAALIMEKSYLFENYSEPICYKDIGDLYMKLEAPQRALSWYKRALKMEAESEYPIELGAYHLCLGSCYKALNNFDDAWIHYKEALKNYIELHGEEHLRTADCYFDLGLMCSAQHHYEKAIKFLQRSLKIKRLAYGDIHYKVSENLEYLGDAYLEKEDVSRARLCFEKSIRILKQQTFVHPLRLANSYCRLYRCLIAQDKLDAALKVCRKCGELNRQVHGENHETAAKNYVNLGVIHGALNHKNDALTCLEKARSIYQQISDPSNPDILLCQEEIDKIKLG